MFRILAICSLGLALLLPAPAQAGGPTGWGYLAWWMPDSWRSAAAQRLERLLFFELRVNADGVIEQRNGWPEKWEELRTFVRNRPLPLDLTLTLFEPADFKALFSSPAATRRLLEEAAALAAHPDVAGLHLDVEMYETLDAATVASYRSFVLALGRELRALSPARQLSVFVPLGGKSDLYDGPTMAGIDYAVMQGYDAHWTGSAQAGPVAPLRGPEAVTWEKAVAKAAALGLPAERTLLGFPLFGYEWQVKEAGVRSATIGHGQTTSFAPVSPQLLPRIRVNVRDRVAHHGAHHDASSGSSTYRFRDASGRHIEGWFEDWWSLQQKTEFLRSHKLRGAAFFVLGYDDDALLLHYFNSCCRHLP